MRKKKSRQYKFLERFLHRVYDKAYVGYAKCGNMFGAMNYGINTEMSYFKKHKRLSREEK